MKYQSIKILNTDNNTTRQILFNVDKKIEERNKTESQLIKEDEDERLNRYSKFDPDTLCEIEKDFRNGNNKDHKLVLWLGNNNLYKDTNFNRNKNTGNENHNNIKNEIDILQKELRKFNIIISKQDSMRINLNMTISGSSENLLNLLSEMKKNRNIKNRIGLIQKIDDSLIEDLSTSMSSSNADDVVNTVPNGKGKDVKVAVWEGGPTQRATWLDLEDTYGASFTSNHARIVCGIIKNKNDDGDPLGYAPECKLYSANSGNIEALRWAVQEKNCTVINQSFHRLDEARLGNLSPDDIEKDYMAYHYPYPMIVQAAGNFWYQTNPANRLNDSSDGTIAGQIGPAPGPGVSEPGSNEYVNHKGFNSICAANHDDTGTALSAGSVFRNPLSLHCDRELPEISANGVSVTAVGIGPWGGTSFSSPATAGIAAQLQSINTQIKTWPEACRAIILAGAKDNITNGEWYPDVQANVDGRDGSGKIDALRSAEIGQTRRAKNSVGTFHGWDASYLPLSSFNSKTGLSTFSYKITMPTVDKNKKKINWSIAKVALCWAAKVSTQSSGSTTTYLSSRLPMDLDLHIYDSKGNLVAVSNTFDNSYEIARFCGNAGETYTIRIKKWSGFSSTWYGIAWRSY